MDFDSNKWQERMRQAQTVEEVTALIMELPDRSLDEMSEEDREFFIMEQEIDLQLSTLRTRTAKTMGG